MRGGPPRRSGNALCVGLPRGFPLCSKKPPTETGPSSKQRSDVNLDFVTSRGQPSFVSTRSTRSRAVPAQSERTVAVPRTYRGYFKRVSDARSYVRCVRRPHRPKPNVGPRTFFGQRFGHLSRDGRSIP